MWMLSLSLGMFLFAGGVWGERDPSRSHRHQHGNRSPSEPSDPGSPAQNTTCLPCEAREFLKKLRLKTIQAQILNKLGFERPPNVSAQLAKVPHHIPMLKKFLETDRGMQSDMPPTDYQEEPAIPMEVLTFAKKPPSYTRDASVVSFNLHPETISLNNLLTATLWYYVRPGVFPADGRLRVSIYQVAPPKYKGGRYSNRLIGHQMINRRSVTNGYWQTVSVEKHVARWLRNSKTQYGIRFVARDLRGRPKMAVVTQPWLEDEQPYKPFIALRVSDRRNSRRKRRLSQTCTESDTDPKCCRYPLRVDFRELGWEFIIAPDEYDANYCAGECPYKYMQQYPVTALLQEVHARGSQGPCCTPTRLAPISMLYYNEKQEIIYGKVGGMVVERCGCS